MRFTSGLTAFALAASLLASPAIASAQTTPSTGPAPADEYFGQYKISVLGMRNALHDLAAVQGQDARVFAKLTGIDDAIDDWRAKYPRDAWLPVLGLQLAQQYTRVNEIPHAWARAAVVENWMQSTWIEQYGGGSDEVQEAAAMNALNPESGATAATDAADPSSPLGPVAVSAAPAAPTGPSTSSTPTVINTYSSAPPPAAPNTKNATVPIVAGSALATAAVLLFGRRHH